MTSGDIRISAERIDGSRCKSLVSVPVQAGGVRRFASAEEATGSPLAAAIFAIPAAEVAEIIVSGNLVTVAKRGPAPWQALGKAVGQAIRGAFASSAPAAAPRAAEPGGVRASDGALYERVAHL